MVEFELLAQSSRKKWRDLTKDQHWVRVGGGLSGQAAGSYDLFDRVQKEVRSRDLKAAVSLVGASGLMHLEPIVDITSPAGIRVFYGNVAPKEVGEILQHHIATGEPLSGRAFAYTAPPDIKVPPGIPELDSLPYWKIQKRIVTANFGNIDPFDIHHYIANGGYGALHNALVELTPQDVLDTVINSGLRGRGGAAFPTGVKWRFLAGSKQEKKYVLCNCEEGDPGAFNDKGVLESNPHTLLEGLILCGYATRSSNGYIFIRHGHDIPIKAAENAVQQAYDNGILGENIFDSGFSFDAEVAFTGDSYVAGEETALMEAIEGKRATPRFKPPFPAVAGLWQKPTNINNVKTLAYVPQIVAKGADWFQTIGTEKSSGTAIICLSGHIKHPGLYEVPMGLTIRELIYEIGGGTPNDTEVKVLQTGGPLGGVMGVEQLDCQLDFDAMAASGAILGSGGIIVGDDTVPVVDLVRNLIAFNQFESCGKCFPCRLGNTHMLEVLDRICKNKPRAKDLQLMEQIGASMKKGSLCGHGQLGYNPISSAMRYFGDEFTEQLQGGGIPVGPFEDGSVLLPTRTRP